MQAQAAEVAAAKRKRREEELNPTAEDRGDGLDDVGHGAKTKGVHCEAHGMNFSSISRRGQSAGCGVISPYFHAHSLASAVSPAARRGDRWASCDPNLLRSQYHHCDLVARRMAVARCATLRA